MSLRKGARSGVQLCSAISKSNNEDPGGTAPTWDRCLVLELAEPWEDEVAQSRHLPPAVLETLDRLEKQGHATRLQCVVPDTEYSAEGRTRVMLYTRSESGLATFRKDEFHVPEEKTGPLVKALLESLDGVGEFGQYRQDTSGIRDIMVCTHGRHDVCCATFGNPIYQLLRHTHARNGDGNLRVWRISHLGGHRFAPNLLDMPEGRNWVRIGAEDIGPLLYRDRPASELKQLYRGLVALASPFEQAAEREIFMREGWMWTSRHVSGQLLTVDEGGQRATVRIDYSDPGGDQAGAYEATVQVRGTVPKVACVGGEVTGEQPQYTVSDLARVR